MPDDFCLLHGYEFMKRGTFPNQIPTCEKCNMAKIITTHVNPPLPVRSSDWSAHYDGDEEGHVGRGSTEAEAVADLLEKAHDA